VAPVRRYFVVLEEVSLDEVSLEPVELEEPVPELLWCFELFFCFEEEELEPLASSLLVPDLPLDVSDEPAPVEPLMPPVEPVVPEPEVVSLGLVEPVLDGELAPVPVPPDDEVSLEDEGLEVDEDEDGLEDELELLPVDDPELLDDAPVELMSIIFAVSPENEARTCSPSWMSDRLAFEPPLVTFVLSSTLSFLSLPESDSVFFCWSNFWTLPWIVS
jgi:hypothetical protein